jgi:hypothetical protein
MRSEGPMLRAARATIAILLAAAALPAEARAQTLPGEVLSWCEGAGRAGRMGAIDGFRCISYLDGVADAVSATGFDVGACLTGSASRGAQLLARFVPTLDAGALGDPDPAALTRQLVAWLHSECGDAIGQASLAETGADARSGEEDALREELAEREAELAALRVQRDELFASLDERQAQVEALVATVDGQALALAERAAAIEARRGEITRLSSFRDALQYHISTLIERQRETLDLLAQSKEEHSRVEAELAAATAGAASASVTADALRDELDAAAARNRELEAMLETANVETMTAWVQIDALNAEMLVLRRELADVAMLADVVATLGTPAFSTPGLEPTGPQPEYVSAIDSVLQGLEQIPPVAQPVAADESLTLGEEEALRAQLRQCWNVPPGALDAGNLRVMVRVAVNPDRTVAAAEIIDASGRMGDPFYRSIADAARRALFLCSPLALPPDRYSAWAEMTIAFDPREMF